jgi:hypothetical protein
LIPAKEYLSSLPTLVRLTGKTLVIGDLHADLDSTTRAIRKFKRGDYENILFLGDYTDRGEESIATINLLLGLMLQSPERVHLLRGNHEILWVNSKHGFLQELEEKGMEALHRMYNDLFSYLPVAAIIDDLVFAVHGGIPEGRPSLSVLRRIPRHFMKPDETTDRYILEMMWNDPTEDTDGFAPNRYRNRLKVYGKKAFKEFMDGNGLEKLVRGHQRWPEGSKYFFGKRLLSIFSCKSYIQEQVTKAAVVEGSSLKVLPL